MSERKVKRKGEGGKGGSRRRWERERKETGVSEVVFIMRGQREREREKGWRQIKTPFGSYCTHTHTHQYTGCLEQLGIIRNTIRWFL